VIWWPGEIGTLTTQYSELLFEYAEIRNVDMNAAVIKVIANGRRAERFFCFRVIGVPKPHE
jgi:hypothetical protein